MSFPKVTVILTSFNHEQYLAEAIDSVLGQTFADFELIIWDDASSDQSWQVIQGYKDPRIRAFCNDKQRRAGYGINKAISEIAQASYIAIHHSDDVWELDKLEKQVAFLDAHLDVGAVFTRAQIIDENGHLTSNEWFNRENQSRWQWLNELFHEENHLNHPSVLIRRQCYQDLGLYSYGLAQTGDAEMWSRLLLSYPIHVLPEKLTRHRLFSDKSNMSGLRPEVLVRLDNEWNFLRTNFLRIQDPAVVHEIFPNLPCAFSATGGNVKFLLAMACLHECTQKNAWHLGIRWLQELMNDAESRAAIESAYTFSYVDLIRLTGQFDVYSVHELAEGGQSVSALHRQIHDLRSANAGLSSQCAQLESVIAERDQSISGLNIRVLETGKRLEECEFVLQHIRSHWGVRLMNLLRGKKIV